MKRLVWTIAVIFIGFGICLTEAQAKLPGEENLIQKIREVLTPAVSAPKNLPEGFLPVCATPAFVWITGHKNELSPEAQKELSLLMPAGRPTYSTTEKTYDTPGGHFRVHYVTSTSDSVYKSHVDVSPADGLPDYVNFVGGIIDSMWRKEVDTLGYLAPPDDGWYPLYPPYPDNGGNARYDVYLKYLDTLYLGYSQPEYYVPPANKVATSYIVLRNDYSLYGGSYNNYPRVTSAHEFFHAIQFGYDPDEYEYVPTDPITPYRPYWMELSATWMEDQIYPSINDYVNYLPYFYKYPWLSLKSFSYDTLDVPRFYHAYASCVWAFYLSEKYGADVIKSIWTVCGAVQGDNVLPATNATLLSKGSSLNNAFREFSIWNYFTNYRADTSNYYSEGNLYPVIEIDTSHSSYPVNVSSVPHPPEVLGTNYIYFLTQMTAGGLSLHFDGSDSAQWKVSVIGYPPTGPKDFAEFTLDSLQSGDVKVHNWMYYDNIVMIPAVVTKTSGSFNYRYSAIYDSTLTRVDEEQILVPNSFALSQNYPNPFNPSTIIPFTVNSSQFMVHSPIHTTLIIYNILGQKVRTLVNEERVPGNYQVVWDGRDDKGEKVSSGIYFYRLQSGGNSERKKMVLIK
jgi:hypothetical protein